jgi:hypothetical protein
MWRMRVAREFLVVETSEEAARERWVMADEIVWLVM